VAIRGTGAGTGFGAPTRVSPANQGVIMADKQHSSDRELINTGQDKRYVRRDEGGRFEESDDVGRSLAQDVRRKAKKEVRAGQGDRGDQRRKG